MTTLTLRPSSARGHAQHGWLNSYHSFSFGEYWDDKFGGFGPLRVINEDRVDPKTGFPNHAHREYEIFSYVVTGELSHTDSVKGSHVEVLKRGDIQMTSTGTGIQHSETNRDSSKPVHFIQIWAKPHTSRLPPKYYVRHFPDESKRDVFVRVVAPVEEEGVVDLRGGEPGTEESGPAPIHSQLILSSIILSPGSTVIHTFKSPASFHIKKGYLHFIMTSDLEDGSPKAKMSIKKGEKELEMVEGDGMFIDQVEEGENVTFHNQGIKDAEVLFFELGP